MKKKIKFFLSWKLQSEEVFENRLDIKMHFWFKCMNECTGVNKSVKI